MSLGTNVGLDPGHMVLDGHPAPPTARGTVAPTFRPVSIVAKRSPISATAELLFVMPSDAVSLAPASQLVRRTSSVNDDIRANHAAFPSASYGRPM